MTDLNSARAATLRIQGGTGGAGVYSRGWVGPAVQPDEVIAMHAGVVSAETCAGAAECETMHLFSARSCAVQGIVGTGVLVAVGGGVLVSIGIGSLITFGAGVSSGSADGCSVDVNSQQNRTFSDESLDHIRSRQNEGIHRLCLWIPSVWDRLTPTVPKGTSSQSLQGRVRHLCPAGPHFGKLSSGSQQVVCNGKLFV